MYCQGSELRLKCKALIHFFLIGNCVLYSHCVSPPVVISSDAIEFGLGFFFKDVFVSPASFHPPIFFNPQVKSSLTLDCGVTKPMQIFAAQNKSRYKLGMDAERKNRERVFTFLTLLAAVIIP